MSNSPENINFEKSRAKSDTHLIGIGAEITVDDEGKKSLEVTEGIKEAAKREMEYSLDDFAKAKKEVIDDLKEGKYLVALSIAREFNLFSDEFVLSPDVQEAGLLAVASALLSGNYEDAIHIKRKLKLTQEVLDHPELPEVLFEGLKKAIFAVHWKSPEERIPEIFECAKEFKLSPEKIKQLGEESFISFFEDDHFSMETAKIIAEVFSLPNDFVQRKAKMGIIQAIRPVHHRVLITITGEVSVEHRIPPIVSTFQIPLDYFNSPEFISEYRSIWSSKQTDEDISRHYIQLCEPK